MQHQNEKAKHLKVRALSILMNISLQQKKKKYEELCSNYASQSQIDLEIVDCMAIIGSEC